MSFITHSDQDIFISCEDQLPKLYNIHNFACSVSGLIILLLQLQPIHLILKYHRHVLHYDAILYILSLLFLFYLNLRQHMIGYVTIDLDSGGALHSIFLSLWLHNNNNNSLVGRNAPLPCNVARILAYTFALVLIGICIFYPNQQSLAFQIISPPFSLYTVITMGIRSHAYKNDEKRNGVWNKWCIAVISLFIVQALVKVEQVFLVCEEDTIIARLFHAVVIHGVIQLLFQSVSNCAIEIIAFDGRNGRSDEKKLE